MFTSTLVHNQEKYKRKVYQSMVRVYITITVEVIAITNINLECDEKIIDEICNLVTMFQLTLVYPFLRLRDLHSQSAAAAFVTHRLHPY